MKKKLAPLDKKRKAKYHKIMKKIIIAVLFCLVTIMTSCKTLPQKPIYVQNISSIPYEKIELSDTTVYSLDYNLMLKEKQDFLSLTVKQFYNDYKIVFIVNDTLKTILDNFFTVAAEIKARKTQDSSIELGATCNIYIFAKDDKNNFSIRLLPVSSEYKNTDTSLKFVLTNKQGYNTLDIQPFNATTIIENKNILIDKFKSISITEANVKTLHDFLNDKESLDILRHKKIIEYKTKMKKAKLSNQTSQ